jgi:hypothetical protein
MRLFEIDQVLLLADTGAPDRHRKESAWKWLISCTRALERTLAWRNAGSTQLKERSSRERRLEALWTARFAACWECAPEIPTGVMSHFTALTA